MRPMLRRIGREAAVFAFYLAVAVAMTWPLAIRMSTAVADPGDPVGNSWILNWVCHALLHSPFELFQSPLYYPSRLPLAFSENLAGVALWVLPFHIAGASPVTLHSIALLLGFAFSGYGAFVLARMITGSTRGAIVAGLIFAFVPFKFDHLSHMQLQWSGWIPLLLAAVIAYWRGPSTRGAVLIGAAFAMNGLTNIHYFLFGSFTAVATVGVLYLFDRRRGTRFWISLAGAFLAGGLVLLPFLLPYRIVAKEYRMRRDEGTARSGSAPMKAWLVATPRSVMYGNVTDPALQRHEMQLFPGLVAIFLAIYGIRSAREPDPLPPPRERRWALEAAILILAVFAYFAAVTDRIEWRIGDFRILSFDSADVPLMLLVILLAVRFARPAPAVAERYAAVLWILIGVLGSFGMNAFFHAFLHRRIGIFQAVRAPVRWAVIAYIGLAIFAAFGVKRSKRFAAVLIPLAMIDLWPAIRWEHVSSETAPVYQWLAKNRISPLIELPASGGNEFRYLLGSAVHHLPQFNGVERTGHPVFVRIREKLDQGQYDDELLQLLERHGCRLIVVHAHAMSGGKEWLARQIASGRLALLRSFDHEIGGDFVFAVTRNFPGWRALREPEMPDGAGHLPSERLARMLAGQAVHSEAIMAVLDAPQSGQHIRGPLNVRGWTLSTFGIKRVTVLLDDARVRVDAAMFERPDIVQRFTWYYYVPKPGFGVTLDERPPGVPRSTNVQVEVEDDKGRITRTEAVVIHWDDDQ